MIVAANELARVSLRLSSGRGDGEPHLRGGDLPWL